ncbi:MAG: hypothetical protein GY820_45400 [Gammaproteobacteria bacterium]|nr:hypothetical protein [Gammaproteobacteria bacterium]
MMKGFYHVERGYWQTLTIPSDDILDSYPEGTIEVPLQPSALHSFNGSEWVAPTQAEIDEQAGYHVRMERNLKLYNEVDAIASNTLRWGALDADTQAQWVQYRTDLLNVPQQTGFPHDVVWPVKP